MSFLRLQPREEPLTYAVVDGRLVLSIGIDTLAYAMRSTADFEDEKGSRLTVKDEEAFAVAIAAQLEGDEDEAGETSITRALIKAAGDVIEMADPSIEWRDQ
jgi:serine/threonine protein kinase HipA of HipAB toxin-antitoxin module